jgi:predicted CXXCH cytochrome family protein
VCHDTIVWTDSTFNHNNTPFPLTGFHTKVPCAQCHVSNNYTTLPTDCYSCHKADYSGTTNPNHTAAGFPTTCTTCHNTSAWIPASWNHTYFPLNHGGANGVCATCHTNPSNYTVFTCTNCHTKANTDANHRGVGGYVYNSINCYNCHKNGGGG